MPQFQVSFDISKLKSGAKDAITIIDGVSKSADKASSSVSKIGYAGKDSSGGIKALGASASDAASNVKLLAAQIVGLVGVYKTLGAVAGFVKRGMDFSSSLESSEIAIASIVSATNNIATAEGKALQGAEKFKAAQGLSKEIMDEIQVLALQTTATFDSLADGVAGIVAPATKAGVELEKLPKFAVTAAQAMATMKIPIQQMRTEIESLLSGNINKAQDLLATNLGITGEMVRDWQKQGILVDELNRRMEAFAIAGAEVADSWSGLKGNMEDALNFLSGKSGKGIFEGAKQSYRELLDLMVSTEGQVGVGKDLENIMGLITEIQNAIGDELISVTRDFIGYIKELNKPENLSDFKKDLNDILHVAKTAFDDIRAVGGLIVGIMGDVFDGWQNLPEPVREYGLILALLGGKKLKIALAALAYSEKYITSFFNAASNTGALNFSEFFEKFDEELSKREGQVAALGALKEPSTSGQSRVSANYGGTDGVGGAAAKPKYKTSSAIGGFSGKASTGKSEAEKFAERSAQYAAGLEKLRNEVDALEKSLDPTLTTFEKMSAKILAERDAAIKNADVKAEETVRRKQATAAQAEETAGLEKRKAELEAQSKLDALNAQNMRDRADFYKELAEKTGEYGTSLEYQTQLLEKQRELWIGMGIPVQDVTEMMRLQREELEETVALNERFAAINSRTKELMQDKYYDKPLAGIELSFLDSARDAFAFRDQMRDSFTSMFGTISDAGTSAFQTIFTGGTFEANKFFANLTAQLAAQAAAAAGNTLIKGIFGLLGNALMSGFTGALGQNMFTGTAPLMPIAGGSSWSSPIAGMHDGGVVGRDATFTRAMPLSLWAQAPRYHTGGMAGFRPDELPIIAQRGETILSRADSGGIGAKLDAIVSLLSAQQTTQGAAGGGNTNVVLVDDQRKVKNYLLSPEGGRTFVTMLNNNRQSIQNIANGGRA
jgi:hypothetical protein